MKPTFETDWYQNRKEIVIFARTSSNLSSFVRKGASFFHNRMDQAELDKSMKLLELVENDVSYVVASSYLPDSASTPVKA